VWGLAVEEWEQDLDPALVLVLALASIPALVWVSEWAQPLVLVLDSELVSELVLESALEWQPAWESVSGWAPAMGSA
jgi:hypothetical protein